MPDDERADKPAPPAEASRIAHTYGFDVVIIFTLDHARMTCRTTPYGRTDRDNAIAQRLADLLGRGLCASPQPEEGFVACPTCDGTMQCVGKVEGRRVFWCPRCGTLRTSAPGDFVPDDAVPKLVERCRKFEAEQVADADAPLSVQAAWHALGVAESINVPADRPK